MQDQTPPLGREKMADMGAKTYSTHTHTLTHTLSNTLTHSHTHTRYLHPEEGDAGQKVHSRLQILQTLRVSCREIILQRRGERSRGVRAAIRSQSRHATRRRQPAKH